MTQLIVERGQTKTLAEMPAYSIALDGYVQGPELDLENRKISFDHHDKCIRMVTSATCKQVLDALLLGLDPSPYTIYVNDVDGDTAMSVWLLRFPHRAAEPHVRQLVEVVAAMDAHGPAYPTANEGLCEGFYERAMASERDARRNKTYGSLDLAALLEDCVGGITALIDSHAGKFVVKAPDAREWAITNSFPKLGWVMVYSEAFVFDLIYKQGFNAAVAHRKLNDGSYEYTIAKRSDLVDFPVGPHTKPGTILHALAAIEPGWGGGSTIGGAPRNADGSRSHLNPTQVMSVINTLLTR